MSHHCITDPACRHFRRPRTVVERWLFDRARGKSCRVCMK